MTQPEQDTKQPNTKPDPTARARLAENYLNLRQLLGLIGLCFPFAFLAFQQLDPQEITLRTSISAYYYSGMRDVFSGSLLVIGLFLICYRGNFFKERALSFLAGLGAIGVAICPTERRCKDAPNGNVFFAEDCAGPAPDYMFWPSAWEGTISTIHYLSAGLFFIMVAFLAAKVFVDTSETRQVSAKQKARRNLVYRWSARVIALCIALLLVDFALNEWIGVNTDPWQPVFWIEAVAVWAFAAAWLVKGEALEATLGLVGLVQKKRP